MKLKFNFIKFVITLFLIFALMVSVYQLYNFLYKAPSTEYAVHIDCEDKVSVKGYFVRDEKVIDTSDSKYFDIIVPNGGKVSKNGIIANVYSTDNAAKIQSDIRELQSKIDEFNSIVTTASKYQDDISYSSEIKKYAIETAFNVGSSNINDAFHSASEFTTNVIKNKIALGEIVDYSQKLEQLKNEMQSLKAQSASVVSYLKAPVSGYFSYRVDGAEQKLNIKMLDKISPDVYETVESLCDDLSENDSAIGKVVKGSDWRVCFKSVASKFENVDIGSTVYIRLPSVTEDKIKCTVIDLCKDGSDIYVVLESNMVNGDLISQRVCEIDIIIDSFSGLRIDKNAVRKLNGEDGVFVKSNGILKYKKVDIIYFASSYVVVKYDPLNTSGVQVFDEVIVKGSDLYDGKVIS